MFLIFAFADYYPHGGAEDFIGCADSLEGAREVLNNYIEPGDDMPHANAQIAELDGHNFNIVEFWERTAWATKDKEHGLWHIAQVDKN